MGKTRCPVCRSVSIKNGTQPNGKQRYLCKDCKKSFQIKYQNKAYEHRINQEISSYLKEGVGIRSISRILEISASTVLKRIKQISSQIKRPAIPLNKEYEMDELCTYIGNKNRRMWIAYAIRKDTREVVDFRVGRRNNRTLGKVIDTLTLSSATKIYTDKLNIYQNLIAKAIHKVKNRGINYIERKNLTLRTHLKRLNRKTICYSKSIAMLTACLKIYFWS
ncbi:MAG: IS1 family transposase [Owenweeksia sp.]